MSCSKTRGREAGFTLVEVIVALAIIALAAVVLIDQRLEAVRGVARSREIRIVWVLASQKLAELELDPTLWLGPGGQGDGDFGEIDPAYHEYTYAWAAVREPVDTVDPLKPQEKPKEIFRLGLKAQAPGLDEPIVLEAMFPVQEPKAPGAATAGQNPPGTPPGSGTEGAPVNPPGNAPGKPPSGTPGTRR